MSLKRLIGLDTDAERYAYSADPQSGYVSVQKVPDHWVATTCGYCSVGCGMFVGVKDGRAVSVRGNPDHPVNLGKDRKSTRLNSSHMSESRMPSSA